MTLVMVVDDDTGILEVVSTVLSIHGYRPVALNNAKNLFAVVEETKPAVIILDVQLGDSDGRELCRQIKEDEKYKHIPVILFSANKYFFNSGDMGCADAFLEKPFEITNLLKVVDSFTHP